MASPISGSVASTIRSLLGKIPRSSFSTSRTSAGSLTMTICRRE